MFSDSTWSPGKPISMGPTEIGPTFTTGDSPKATQTPSSEQGY